MIFATLLRKIPHSEACDACICFPPHDLFFHVICREKLAYLTIIKIFHKSWHLLTSNKMSMSVLYLHYLFNVFSFEMFHSIMGRPRNRKRSLRKEVGVKITFSSLVLWIIDGPPHGHMFSIIFLRNFLQIVSNWSTQDISPACGINSLRR